MRPVTFHGSNEEHRTAFNVLFSAWHFTNEQGFALVNTTNSPQRNHAAIEVQKLFDKMRFNAGPGRYTLAPAGGEMALDDGQFDLLQEFYQAYKKLPHPPAAASTWPTVDRFLAAVPSVNAEQWEKVKERERQAEIDRLVGKDTTEEKGAGHAVQGDGQTDRG